MAVHRASPRRAAVAVAGLVLPALVAGSVWLSSRPSDGQEPGPRPTPPSGRSVVGPCDWVRVGGAVPQHGYVPSARSVEGDLDGDGAVDRVEVLTDDVRPQACRFVLRVRTGAGAELIAVIAPLEWPGTAPEPLMVAEIDGRPGVEVVLDLSPAAVYRPGAVFTVRDGGLVRMELQDARPADLFPLDDEFPAGVGCTADGGTIVVSWGALADGGNDDRRWEITRTTYVADGSVFEPIGAETHVVDVGSEARRWPELGGEPFRSCPFVNGGSGPTDGSA